MKTETELHATELAMYMYSCKSNFFRNKKKNGGLVQKKSWIIWIDIFGKKNQSILQVMTSRNILTANVCGKLDSQSDNPKL